MRDKRRQPTLSEACRLYTGSSLLKNIVVYSVLEMMAYIFLSYFHRCMLCFSGELSFVDSLKVAAANLSQRDGSSPIMWMSAVAISTEALLIPQYDRSAPGGKLFRTVKGGFETFKRYRIGVYLSFLAAVTVCATGVFLLDHFKIIGVTGGISYSINCLTSIVLTLIVFCFVNRFKNVIPSIVISTLMILVCTLSFGVLTDLNKETVLPFVILLAVGLAILPIAMSSYFAFYKRKYWD